MKKLLFNKDRTKIFNLDQWVSIERIDKEYDDGCRKGIILKFSSEDYFLITPGDNSEILLFLYNIGRKEVYLQAKSGNCEENKKLYEFFEHKFTRSSLCQNAVDRPDDP